MTPENKEHFVSEKEAIFFLLTGIGDDIYSTVDACKTANKMWIAIERLQQGESIERYKIDPDKLSGIRTCKRIALSLQSISRSSTNLPTTTFELLQTLRTRLKIPYQGSQVVQQNMIQCFNCKGFGHYAKECRKPKRVKDYTYHKEKMMMCKQAKQGVPLQAEQADWLADTDEEIDEQELEAHYSFMAKIQEVLPEESGSTEQPLEQVHNNDENNEFANERQHSENNTAECADERDALANLIANLTLDTEENKMILKQLKKANTSY
ncbi:retrovirus-related pol polyprotein from transposon TNT 1-94 [Tanacetum coccineum]